MKRITRMVGKILPPTDESDEVVGRSAHRCFFDSSTKTLFVFGGRLLSEESRRRFHTNELVSIKILDKTIEWNIVKTTAVDKNEKNIPPPIHCFSSCFRKGIFWMCGGSGSGGFNSDLYGLDIKKKKWKRVQFSGKCADSMRRHAHESVLIGKNEEEWIQFGGHLTIYGEELKKNPSKKKRTFFNDLHRINLKTLRIEKLEMMDTPPRPRSWCSMGRLSSTLGVVFGGFRFEALGREVYFNDTHVFDIHEMCWYECKLIGEEIPHVRNRASFTKIGPHTFLLFGGNFYNGTKDIWFNDAYLCDITVEKKGKQRIRTSVKWTRIDVSRCPKISHHIAYLEDERDRIVIFGGEVNFTWPKEWWAMELVREEEEGGKKKKEVKKTE